MFKKNILVFFISLIFPLVSLAAASDHYVIVPKCLLKKFQSPQEKLADNNTLVFFKTNQLGVEELVFKKERDRTACGGFRDVTTQWLEAKKLNARPVDFLKEVNVNSYAPPQPYTIQYEKEVAQLLSSLNAQNMWTNLTTLSNFKDRYANSDKGLEAANWIKNRIETIAKTSRHEDVTVYTIPTKTYKQPSVIAKFGTSTEPGIVIGAHMDTLSSMFTKKPGADDDGTGTVTVLETARVILESGMKFSKPIYFMWYAAEEEGLVGSGVVVAEFKKQNIPISAVLHFDMTGYSYRKDRTIWLVSDNTDKNLSTYLEDLIKTYVKQPINYLKCGYACSDHASWTQNGYVAACPFESSYEHMNPDIHTSKDTLDKLSLEHMTDFAKLAIAFTTELAEPRS